MSGRGAPPSGPSGTVRARLRRGLGTVRVRTTAAATAVVALALVAAGTGLVLLLHARLDEQAAGAAENRAADVATELRGGVPPGRIAVGTADDRFVQVLDGTGGILAASGNATARPLRHGAPGAAPVRLARPLADGGDFVVATAVARTSGGDLLVLAGVSLEDAADSARLAAGLLAVGVPLLVLVVAGTTWLAVGRTLAPVDAIRAEVDAISAADLHRRVGAGGADEIGRLARTMNRMLERLERSQQRQRQFVSDASHELRSPVASIRQHVEVALEHPERTSVPELAATVLAEDRRIERLVDDFVVLARADENGATQRVPVDVDDLVLAHAARVRGVGGVTVDLAGLGAGRVLGDARLLDRVVANLVDNAVRHAASRVALSLAHDVVAGVVVLAVDDDGPGIAPADRDRVLARFVRLDDARDRDSGGAGLGLAIVAEVARAHGGSVRVAEAPLGGARVEVRLPAAP